MQFADLNDVELRTLWPNEARDFTPWLADNLEHLSRAIGIPLELEKAEAPVELFSADILARNPTDNSLVLIENQLEQTDHTHLGQVLTYLAGLQAQTVIWIARDFRPPHLSAVQWLNQNTTDPFAFLAVQVKVVQIGDQPDSPKSLLFNVLEKPNEWDRQVKSKVSDTTTELGAFRNDFWMTYAQEYPDDIQLRASYKISNIFHHIQGLVVSQYLAQKGVGVYIQTQNRKYADREHDLARQCANALTGHTQDDIPGPHISRSLNVDSNDRDNWPRMTGWLHDTLEEFRQTINSIASDNPQDHTS